ncbi:hypothetical protein PCANC_19980 [Puccinia coronata f. sp. avenae]|uniref:Transcription regulator Rua1 C-terminal domain-containing protein n=1 Tax=Puccinia coronata f. sp. avenae TaxID=200324 RepID=A0A2N5S775_9BASI|nr:hypothetical protein PCASD_24760 [Puccinia coronata f. sp. avenae]PLW15296.1 hypothetical protein PCANC_19980 [Puccinia coronata f. sp. avenae]
MSASSAATQPTTTTTVTPTLLHPHPLTADPAYIHEPNDHPHLIMNNADACIHPSYRPFPQQEEQHPSHHPPPPPDHHHSPITPHTESSPDTFFASHKAHRSFRGVVEKFHQGPSANNQLDRSFNPTQWNHWPLQPQDPNKSNPLHGNHQVLDSQRIIASNEPTPKHQDFPLPAAPYRTRSLVHRLINRTDQIEPTSHLQPSDSSSTQPFFYDCLSSSQFSSSRSASHSNSSSINPPLPDLRSVLNRHEEPPANPQPIQSSTTPFDSNPNRNRDGLPSNSHHLLNSPELKTAQVQPNTHQAGSIQYAQLNKHQDHAETAATDLFEPQPDTQQSTLPQSSKAANKTTTNNPSTKRTTPQKGKVDLNRPLDQSSSDPPNQHHPPSEDAASILLTLSRHEPPKHGMSLRRGRGGAGSRADSQQTEPSDPRSLPLPTPNEPRYRTRSQINEELPLDNQAVVNQNSSLVPISYPNHEFHPGTNSAINNQPQSHILPSSLGYGFPTGHHQNLISVSGSTSASTCTSRSNTGDGSTLNNMTPNHELAFSFYNVVGKPQTSLPGRPHLKASGVSTPLSMAHSSMANSLIHGGVGMMDDDAKSSFSISTQATSLISPPGYFTRRTFPPEVPIDPHFPRLYRSFFVPSAFGDREPIKSQAESYKISVMKTPPNSNFNTPAHGYLDLYTPRYVKGVGAEKLGLCCICAEPKDRGGGDAALWLKMKVSSYSYHLSFFHGINNADGLPFSPPVEIRLVKRCHVAANEKLELKEGRCHQCNKWVPMEGVKMQEVKVPELFWWKHAKSCHKSRLAGECHVHIPDEIFDLVTRQQPNASGSLYNGAGGYLPMSSCSTPYSYFSPNDLPLSNSPYGSRCHAASPAPTCASSVSHSGGSRVHPSVAAQRASAGRVYKRKASNSSLSGRRRTDSFAADPAGSPQPSTTWPAGSPQPSTWQPSSLSAGNAPPPTEPLPLHHHPSQHPQSPTPTHPTYPVPNGRKTRRSNMLNETRDPPHTGS